jgi:hypothetical protein
MQFSSLPVDSLSSSSLNIMFELLRWLDGCVPNYPMSIDYSLLSDTRLSNSRSNSFYLRLRLFMSSITFKISLWTFRKSVEDDTEVFAELWPDSLILPTFLRLTEAHMRFSLMTRLGLSSESGTVVLETFAWWVLRNCSPRKRSELRLA